ncbi:MAG: hypothetical protein ABL996_18435 [Micropepsaceae bacterium]
MHPHRTIVSVPAKPSRLVATLALALACASAGAATSAFAETVVLDCDANKQANICPSRWVIDGDAQTVTMHWCKDPDHLSTPKIEITEDRITIHYDEIAGNFYDIDRKTGRMTILGESYNGITRKKYNGGETVCRESGK